MKLSKFLPQPTKNKLHKLQSRLAAFRYGYPSKKLTVIGVTGTKGKTSVCNIVASILDAANLPNAMETTINTKIADKITYHSQKNLWVTTPPAKVLQKFLHDILKTGITHVVLEVTSQAIDQSRTYGINFDVLVYTNLSHDHIDYHGSKENYLNTKLKVFKQNPQAKFIINRDDQYWNLFYNLAATEKFLYSTKNPVEHGTVARKMLLGTDSATFTVAHENGQTTVDSHLPGTFNISNMLAAFCVGLALDIKPETIKLGLENVIGIRGRMEQIIASPKQDFTVIVDYAHNADSLKNVYETVRESIQKAGGRLIAVLGATGRRDTTKRPIMGALAGNFADLILVTDEDPYDEDPMSIIEAVAAGVLKGGKKNQWRLNRNYWKVLDRKQAIHKAIGEAQKGDVVVITGKGAEEVMAVGEHEFIPFSDRKIAKEELERRFKR
jgi:UDP-N-acetylmuramoyl-L-alanyl-D-glutamate--2,6-diaminopimelate ligase